MACFIAQGLGGTADLSLRALVTSQEKIRGTVGKHTPRTRACLSLMQGFEEKPQESQGQWRGWSGVEWGGVAKGQNGSPRLWECRLVSTSDPTGAAGLRGDPGDTGASLCKQLQCSGLHSCRALPLLKFLEGDKPKSVSSGFIVG